MQPRISIFIPAYNAAAYLEGVVALIPADLWTRIISVWIINDGSTDATRQVADHLSAGDARIKAIHFPANCGYGTVVKQGLTVCRSDGCDYAVCLHGDGQYPAAMISAFIDYMVTHKLDILQGSRHAGNTALSGGMPFYKYCAGKLLCVLENRIFKLSLTDYHSGFLTYSRRALEQLRFEPLSDGFEIDLELIACARAANLTIGEKPIPTRYAGEQSYNSPIPYGIGVLKVLHRFLQGRYQPA
jgi:glycosyltransferase involved in cell wall biosynthesis